MPSTGFLQRSVNVVAARVETQRKQTRPGLQRAVAAAGGLLLAVTMFFVLKGFAVAAGVGLPNRDGIAFWLVGADPVSSAFSVVVQPMFSGRG